MFYARNAVRNPVELAAVLHAICPALLCMPLLALQYVRNVQFYAVASVPGKFVVLFPLHDIINPSCDVW